MEIREVQSNVEVETDLGNQSNKSFDPSKVTWITEEPIKLGKGKTVGCVALIVLAVCSMLLSHVYIVKSYKKLGGILGNSETKQEQEHHAYDDSDLIPVPDFWTL